MHDVRNSLDAINFADILSQLSDFNVRGDVSCCGVHAAMFKFNSRTPTQGIHLEWATST